MKDGTKESLLLAIPATVALAYYSESDKIMMVAGAAASALMYPLLVEGSTNLFIEEPKYDKLTLEDLKQIKKTNAIEQFKKGCKIPDEDDSDDFDCDIEYVGSRKSTIKKLETADDFFNPESQFDLKNLKKED